MPLYLSEILYRKTIQNGLSAQTESFLIKKRVKRKYIKQIKPKGKKIIKINLFYYKLF